eukprot:4086122-Pleurochrysis_carterae.AAC.1
MNQQVSRVERTHAPHSPVLLLVEWRTPLAFAVSGGVRAAALAVLGQPCSPARRLRHLEGGAQHQRQ